MFDVPASGVAVYSMMAVGFTRACMSWDSPVTAVCASSTIISGPDQIGAFDGNDGGEEELCARALDSVPDAVLKHWVRNVAQHPNAFWLPLAESRFYPDFVAELTDGRLLVVEYKGEHIVTTDDTKEKVAVGLKWEQAMAGMGLFLLAANSTEGQTPREQILDRIR